MTGKVRDSFGLGVVASVAARAGSRTSHSMNGARMIPAMPIAMNAARQLIHEAR